MATYTLDDYYNRDMTLIEDYSDGQYLTVADSAVFKDLFDKMYKDRVILGTSEYSTSIEDEITLAHFKRNWERMFFANVMTVKKQREIEVAADAIAASKQKQTGKTNLYPQNGLTPIASGFASTESTTETETSQDLKHRMNEDRKRDRNAIESFVRMFSADLWSVIY